MRQSVLIRSVLILSFSLIAISAPSEEALTSFASLPDEMSLINVNEIAAEYPFMAQCFAWPSHKKIQRNQTTNICLSIRHQFESWARIVIKESLIPHDIQRRVVFISKDVDDTDFARVRYLVDEKYFIQIAQTNDAMWVVIRDANEKEITDLKSVQDTIKRIITNIFNKSNIIEGDIFRTLKTTPYGLVALPDRNPRFWFESVGVHSDGLAVGFTFSKVTGGATVPWRKPDWLKPEPFRVTRIHPEKAPVSKRTRLELTGAGFDSTVKLFADEQWTSEFADGISIRNVVAESPERLSFDIEVSGETSARVIDFQLVKPPSAKPEAAGVVRFSFELVPEFE